MNNTIVTKEEMHSSFIEWQTISNAYAFLASVLNNQPSNEMLAEFAKVGKEGEDKENIYNNLFCKYFKDNRYQSKAFLVQELSVEWTRLFRGISPTYGARPPYAGIYMDENGTGISTIALIAQMYSKYGLGIQEGKQNRMDYLGVQLDFVSILSAQAAQAVKMGDCADMEAIKNDAGVFLQKYILSWFNKYLNEAQKNVKSDFFRGYLMMLEESLNELSVLILN